jgi:hypothetical protein
MIPVITASTPSRISELDVDLSISGGPFFRVLGSVDSGSQPDAEVGHRAGQQRQPEIHDPVAEHGQHRRRSWRAEADRDRHQRHLDDPEPARVSGMALAMFAAA